MAHVVATMIEIIDRYLHEKHNLLLLFDAQITVGTAAFLVKARSLRDFLVNSDFILKPFAYRGADPLLIRIIDAVHEAEDVVEIYIWRSTTTTTSSNSNSSSSSNHQGVAAGNEVSIHDELVRVAKEFETIKQEILNRGDNQPKYLFPVDNSPPDPSTTKKRRKANDFVAIYEEEFQALKSRLLQGTLQLQFIPILGLPGMGKRSLAFRLYNDSSVANHFRITVWVNTAYLEKDAKVILLDLLNGLGMLVTKEIRRQTVDELGVLVREALRYMKYFIVIHNVFNEDMLITLRRFFPEDGIGSRVLLTAIPHHVGRESASHDGEAHMMRYLSDSESCVLFCHKVFGLHHFPDTELETIGKRILGHCKGIALVVVCIAGLLATSKKQPSFWELVAVTLSSHLAVEDDHRRILAFVLGLIYNHLPYYLKPCLLYSSAFNVSCDIQTSNIIKLWIAEGFIRQTSDDTLEDIAEASLEILVDKNLLHLSRHDYSGRVKAFQVVPIFKAFLCFISCTEKFAWSRDVMQYSGVDENARIVSGRQLFHPEYEIKLSSVARSFLSSGEASPQPTPMFVRFILLRVLDVFQLELFQFPQELLQLVLLRFLAFSCHSNIPASISKLRNLQALIIRRLPWIRSFTLPMELLDMAQLTHIKCKETFIWYYPQDGKKFLHGKLQTLTNMQLVGASNEFFQQIPNVRKLGIFCNIAMHYTLDLACLERLERLKCSSDWSLASTNFLSHVNFPSSVRKLTLHKCRIPWGFMKLVGALSSLEELKVQNTDFLGKDSSLIGPEWESETGEFPRLLSLRMVHLNLVHWKAHASHFPRLQQLVIIKCCAMMGLPVDFGDIESLELIHVDKSNPFLVDSAMQIKDRHEGSGHPFLEVQIAKA